METKHDEFHGQGGSYIVNADGKRERVQAPTRDHPDGNRPRDKDGKPIVSVAPQTEDAKPQPQPQPKTKKGGE